MQMFSEVEPHIIWHTNMSGNLSIGGLMQCGSAAAPLVVYRDCMTPGGHLLHCALRPAQDQTPVLVLLCWALAVRQHACPIIMHILLFLCSEQEAVSTYPCRKCF